MIGTCRKTFLIAIACGVAAARADVTPEQRGIVEQWIKTAAKTRTVQGEFDQIRYLKGVNKPLIRPGRIWMEKPSNFRWQIGEPPSMIAVRGKDETLTVVDAREKKARVWNHEALLRQEAEGKGQGIAMLGAGLGDSMAAFEKQFEIDDVKQIDGSPRDYAFSLSLRDRTARVFVKSITLTVGLADGALRSFVVLMRDGSRMETVVKKYVLNAPIPSEIFRLDTTGYEVEEVKPQ